MNKEAEQKLVPGTKGGQCPRCGGDLLLKLGKFGKFYGCSHFPTCKFTKQIPKEELHVVLSDANPEKALRILKAEQERRITYYWQGRDTQYKVANMSEELLKNVIATLEQKLGQREVIEDNMGDVD